MSPLISMVHIAAGACSLALLTACVVVPGGTTYSTAPAVKTVAPATTAAARQTRPATTTPDACAPDEIRVASGACRARSLYAGADDGGGSGGGSGGGGSGGGSGGGGGGSGGGNGSGGGGGNGSGGGGGSDPGGGWQ